MSATTSSIVRLRELGGELFLYGDRVRYRIPASCPEARGILEKLRQNRETIRQMLRDQQSKPPSLEEVLKLLPPGVRLVSYRPKDSPFAVAPVSIVTNGGKFFRAYLNHLAWRVEHPEGHAAPPLPDILAKLADGGLTLQVEATARK